MSGLHSRNARVVVVVPVWNEPPEFFRSCVKSIARQTYNSDLIRLSVYDDGSEESNSEQYCRILEKTQGIDYRYEAGATNEGVSYARNRAIEDTDADVIVPLDADDILHPQAIKQIVEGIASSEMTELVYSDNLKFSWPKVKLYQYRKKHLYHRYLTYYKNTVYDPLYQSTFVVGVQGYYRDTFDAVGGYDESNYAGEDVDFLLKVHGRTDAVNFNHIPRVLYYRRHDPQGLSRSKQSEMHHTTERAFLENLRRLDTNIDDVEYHGRVKPYQVSHYLLRKTDGTVVNTPYFDPTRGALESGPSQDKLREEWKRYHRPKLLQWVQHPP